MDAYLHIAEHVLRVARRPLSARQILSFAFQHDLVPPQLHGRTQHKTLGARLSEDILLLRDRSAFFRTSPGHFFLRCFLTDSSISEEYRVPMIARRRQRELVRGRVMTVPAGIAESANEYGIIPTTFLIRLFEKNFFSYANGLDNRFPEEIAVWAFVMVTRGPDVLTYRRGRYREDRDTFLQRRSIGFFAPVEDQDYDLFDSGDRGIIASGLKAVVMDLDLPASNSTEYEQQTKLECFINVSEEDQPEDLLAVIRFECPRWFEPLRRRLAINDLNWMNLQTPINDIADFDPWSQKVLLWSRLAYEPVRHAVEKKIERPNTRARRKALGVVSRSKRPEY